MSSKSILFISPNFPPKGGIGVQRPIAFVKGLKKAGYNPIVLTVSEDDIKQTFGVIDNSRNSEIDELNLTIHRVSSGKRYAMMRRLMKLRIFRLIWIFNYHRYWDDFATWPKHAESIGLEIIKNNDIRVIYSCSGPFSAIELAKNLKEKTGVIWISDLRDPLTEHFNIVWPTKWHWKWVRKLENKLYPEADHTIVVTEEMRNIYSTRFKMDDSQISVIENGF